MKKKTLLFLIKLIFIVCFNAIFFIQKGFQNTPAIWLCYAFVLFSYAAILLTPHLCGSDGQKPIYFYTPYLITGVYFFVELVFNSIEIFFIQTNFRMVLICNIISTGIYLIILFTMILVNSNTNQANTQGGK